MATPLLQPVLSSIRLLSPAVLVIFLLEACTALPSPTPVPLPQNTPDRWVSEPPSTTAGIDQTERARWWEDFGDPELSDFVERVLNSNLDLAAAAARIEGSSALARIAGAGRLPQINAELGSSRRRQNFIGLPIPGSAGRPLSTTTTSHSPLLTISWEADLWSRIGAERGAALLDHRASKADFQSARLSLAGHASKAWFGLLEARAQADLAAETLDSRRTTATRIQRRYNLGLRPALDLRLATSNVATAEAILAMRRQQLEEATRSLEVLLDDYPRADPTLVPKTGHLPSIPAPPSSGLPAGLLVRRPDLIAAEQRLTAAGLRIHAAKAALYPQVRLTGSAGRLSQDLEDLLDSKFSVWSLAANLLQPIFQGGRLRAGLELATARQKEALHFYSKTVLTAFSEVETALAAQKYLEQQKVALEGAVRQATAAERLAQDRYDAGLASYLLYLESQRQATAAKSQLLQIQLQQLNARVDLYLALGGNISDVAEI